MNDKHKHLEFIQHTIHRLADNSFRLKQWSVLLAAAILALLSQQPAPVRGAIFISLIPVFIFWGLDGYFIWQERRYFKQCFRILRSAQVFPNLSQGRQ